MLTFYQLIFNDLRLITMTKLFITYYGRKKYPDPPIINTDNTHMSRRNF